MSTEAVGCLIIANVWLVGDAIAHSWAMFGLACLWLAVAFVGMRRTSKDAA